MRTTRSNEEFLSELADLIKKEGIASMSVAEMAARLRCSRRRLYDVAATKEDLLLEVAKWQFRDSLAAGEKAAAAESDPARRLTAYLGAGLRSAEALGAGFLADLQQSTEGRALFDDFQLTRSKGAREILEAGARIGEFKAMNFDVVTEVLLGAASRLRNPEFLRRSKLTIPQAFGEAYALVLQGLLVQTGEAKEITSKTRPPNSSTSRRSKDRLDKQGANRAM